MVAALGQRVHPLPVNNPLGGLAANLLFFGGQSTMLRIFEYMLWVPLPVLQSAIGYRMWTRQLYRDYPLFFAYTIEQLLRFLALFYCYHWSSRGAYSQAYFGLNAVEAVLQLGVISELFFHTFRPYAGITHLASALLRWAAVILLLIAVLLAALTSSSDFDLVLAAFFAMERSLQIVQGGLLFLLFVLTSALGLRWRQPSFGIALGFGIFTSVNLAAYSLRVQFGMTSHEILSFISSAGYNCAVLVWLVSLYAREPILRKLSPHIPTWDLESWNQALLNLLRR